MQDNITKILKAIADPTRREIFQALVVAATALPIHKVCGQFNITRQGITKHILILEEAGLIKIERKGRERICEANTIPLKEVTNWLKFYEKFWDDSLDKLDTYLSTKSE